MPQVPILHGDDSIVGDWLRKMTDRLSEAVHFSNGGFRYYRIVEFNVSGDDVGNQLSGLGGKFPGADLSRKRGVVT